MNPWLWRANGKPNQTTIGGNKSRGEAFLFRTQGFFFSGNQSPNQWVSKERWLKIMEYQPLEISFGGKGAQMGVFGVSRVPCLGIFWGPPVKTHILVLRPFWGVSSEHGPARLLARCHLYFPAGTRFSRCCLWLHKVTHHAIFFV